MINIKVKDNEVTINGHANYDEYGHDIVCASVSSVIYTTVNGIMNIDKSAIKFVDDKVMTITILNDSEIVHSLFTSMVSILEDLERQYPKNIKISKGE